MNKKSKRLIIIVSVILVLGMVSAGAWGIGKLKGHTNKRAQSMKQDVEQMLEAIDSDNVSEFEKCFSPYVSSQIEISERFAYFSEYIGKDAQITEGKVTGVSYHTSQGGYDDEVWMRWKVVSGHGTFFVRVQKRFHPDPYLNGISYMEAGTEGSDMMMIIGSDNTN